MHEPYVVKDIDAVVAELRLGAWLMWLHEWAKGDQDPHTWGETLREYCAEMEDVTVQLVSPGHDITFAFNADLVAPPIAWFHTMIEAAKYFRTQGGIVIPTKAEVLTAQQVPPEMLRRGPQGLRAVDPQSRPGRHLRSVD